MEGVSIIDTAGSCRRATGIRVEGIHGPTKGSIRTEVGEGGEFREVVVSGGTRSESTTGAAQGRAGQGRVEGGANALTGPWFELDNNKLRSSRKTYLALFFKK